jgi:hypothetical protein
MFYGEPNITEDFIAQTLRTYGLRATIHRDEDALLNKMHFGTRMPTSFRTPGSPYFNDPLARYKESGLFDDLVPLPTEGWYPS